MKSQWKDYFKVGALITGSVIFVLFSIGAVATYFGRVDFGVFMFQLAWPFGLTIGLGFAVWRVVDDYQKRHEYLNLEMLFFMPLGSVASVLAYLLVSLS